MSFYTYNRWQQLATVNIDAAAIPGYLGAAYNDGVLRVDQNELTYTDGGDYITLGLADHNTARTALGLAIGTDVQAYHAALASIVGLTYVSGSFIALTAADTYAVRTYAQVLSDIGAAATSHAMSTHSDEDTYNINTSGSATVGGTVTIPTALTGVIRADSGVLSVDSDVTDIVTAASTTAQGKVELTIASEINTGTSTILAVTPDSLAGSYAGTKTVIVKAIADDTALTTGDGKMYFTIPIELNGMNLVTVGAHVYTNSTSGTPTFAIYNFTDSQDMLSTNITIDINEPDSSTAATAAVINTSYDDVVTGDAIRFDCDVAGTGTKGMEIRMGFRKP